MSATLRTMEKPMWRILIQCLVYISFQVEVSHKQAIIPPKFHLRGHSFFQSLKPDLNLHNKNVSFELSEMSTQKKMICLFNTLIYMIQISWIFYSPFGSLWVWKSSSKLLFSSSAQFSSVAQSCPTLCDPMDYSTPGIPVHHQLPEFTQTHVHQVSDAIQPSRPLLCPSPPAPNPSQHQGLFQWVNSSYEVAKVLE